VDDFRAIPINTRIGTVHAGFYDGMEKVESEIRAMLDTKQPIAVDGHSLGASRANVLSALLVTDGIVPVRLAAFGEPRSGYANYTSKIADIPGNSYRNGTNALFHDVVTDVPFTLRPTPFVHRNPLYDIDEEPEPDLLNDLSIFAFHHIQLYNAGVHKYIAALKVPPSPQEGVVTL
jgi:hypothetical protein